MAKRIEDAWKKRNNRDDVIAALNTLRDDLLNRRIKLNNFEKK